MNKHYYARYDRFQAAHQNSPGVGFANTNAAIAFDSKKKRDQFVKYQKTFDYSCEPIKRKEAMTMLENVPCTNDKGLPLNNLEDMEFFVMKYWNY
jgi:hypothetical protein